MDILIDLIVSVLNTVIAEVGMPVANTTSSGVLPRHDMLSCHDKLHLLYDGSIQGDICHDCCDTGN